MENLNNSVVYVTIPMERYNELIALENGTSAANPEGIKITHLNLRQPVHRMLSDNKIDSTRKLISCVEDRSIQRFRGVGKKVINEVIECLKKHNLIHHDFPLKKTADSW